MDEATIEDVVSCLREGSAVRRDLPGGGRVHIDRSLPFLCLHELRDERPETAARHISMANAAYLLTRDVAAMVPLINAIGRAMREAYGGFALFEFAELEQDALLKDDSDFLPPFEIRVLSNGAPHSPDARHAFCAALAAVEPKYRTPQIEEVDTGTGQKACRERLPGLDEDIAWLRAEFAPIYRQPESEDVYPDLLERVVANLYDAGLQGLAAFVRGATSLRVQSHRSMGRQVLIDAVRRVDRQIDDICSAFDFLLAVTPINAQDAWTEFRDNGCAGEPRLLYRPLSIDTDRHKRELFSIQFEQLEDPVLVDLYQEKQGEIDVQLTMLQSRGTARFREASRVLYGSVEQPLKQLAQSILADTQALAGRRTGPRDETETVDCFRLKDRATEMVEDYRSSFDGFKAGIAIREDLPAGLMVSGRRLLISRHTSMPGFRVEALLSHEIGVHLLTYFNGDAQGLRLFRSGLAGYEGLQEGLAVFAEYAVGGLTATRLRLLAARVLACDAMLDGAEFSETFRLLTKDHGLSRRGAFNVALRAYRSGGLAKDAIYLRGLGEVLSHLENGGDLEPFWIGKIAGSHLPVIEELRERGLLKPIPATPAFMSRPEAKERIAAARSGLSPIDLVADQSTL